MRLAGAHTHPQSVIGAREMDLAVTISGPMDSDEVVGAPAPPTPKKKRQKNGTPVARSPQAKRRVLNSSTMSDSQTPTWQ